MPVRIREYQIPNPVVSKQEPIVQITKPILTLTDSENKNHFQHTPHFNQLPISHSTSKPAMNIKASMNTEQRPNSLTDMKNTLNIQLTEKQISMKRKSPINEEEFVKNDLKRPMKFVSNLNGNYNKNSNLKENGGGDSNGIDGDESDELEIIDSEMDEEDIDEEDDEEFDDEDDYEDEEDIAEEIDLEEEDDENDEDMEAENGKTLVSYL